MSTTAFSISGAGWCQSGSVQRLEISAASSDASLMNIEARVNGMGTGTTIPRAKLNVVFGEDKEVAQS